MYDFKTKFKNSYKSLTIWLNGLLLVITPYLDLAQQYLPGIQEYVSGNIYKYLIIAVIVLNLLLRFRTKNSLSDK